MRMGYVLHFMVLAATQASVVAGAKCGGGDPCIFVNRDVGWVPMEENPTQSKPPPVYTDSWNRSDTSLFVAISSFRDKLCPITLFNMFTKASHPNRIITAVVQQNIPGDVDCYEEYCNLMRKRDGKEEDKDWCPFSSNIKMKRLDGNTARGPTWARSFGSKMITDEEFCMQTDSHMDFMPGWDSSMLAMWALTQNEYAVLSTYVTDSADIDRIKDKSKGINGLHEVPHLCIVKFHGLGGMPRNYGTKCLRMFPKPKLTNAVWGAGLSFAKCHAERKVPYDPFTPGIFDGEEWSRAARYWTWGYDIYTPHRVYITHNYRGSQSDPVHSRWHSNALHKTNGDKEITLGEAQARLRLLLHMDEGMENITEAEWVRRGKYGLGDRRSFDQLKEFSGVDPGKRMSTGDRCGNIDYVPFKEHPLGANYIPRFDPETLQFLDEPDEGSIYFDPLRVARETHSPRDRQIMKEKRHDVLLSALDKAKVDVRPGEDIVTMGRASAQRIRKGVPLTEDSSWELYLDIFFELSLCFFVLFLVYYCMIPSRSTTKVL